MINESAERISHVKIDMSAREQIVRGFGVSGAWWAQIIGGWQEKQRKKVIELLFSQDTGIGLGIYRYNIGGGAGSEIADHWRRTETFEVGAGTYDWSKDGHALLVAEEACQFGVHDVVAFANSAPGRLTVSGTPTGDLDGKSNLKNEMYLEYCDYLIDIAMFLKSKGIPIKWISPVNEPYWNWNPAKGQEGCHFSPDECVRLIQILADRLNERQAQFRISAIDCEDWSKAINYTKILDLANAQPLIDHFSVHSYFSERHDKIKFSEYMRANYPHIDIHMSEWTEMQTGRDLGMQSALKLAQMVYEDFTFGRVSSWQYWIGVSKYNFLDGLIYTDSEYERFCPCKRLWAFGNFSKFVKSGYQHVACESTDLACCAFHDLAGRLAVLVVINDGDEKRFNISLRETTVTCLTIYETSDQNDLQKIYRGTPQETYRIPSDSIWTLIMSLDERSSTYKEQL